MNKIKNNHTPPNYNNFSILTECLIFLIYVALSLENTSIIFNKMPINKYWFVVLLLCTVITGFLIFSDYRLLSYYSTDG